MVSPTPFVGNMTRACLKEVLKNWQSRDQIKPDVYFVCLPPDSYYLSQ